MKLVDDWKYAWKWASMNCMALAAAIQGAWIYIPEDMRDSIPHNLVTLVTVALLLLGMFARIVKQKPLKKTVKAKKGKKK